VSNYSSEAQNGIWECWYNIKQYWCCWASLITRVLCVSPRRHLITLGVTF